MISACPQLLGPHSIVGALFVLAVALAKVHVTYIVIITIELLTVRGPWVPLLNSPQLQAHLDRAAHHRRRGPHDLP